MSDTTHNRAEVLTDEQILAMAETALIGVHDKGRLETHVMRGTDIAHCVIGFARALLSQAAPVAAQPVVNQCPYCFTFNGHQPGCGVLGTTIEFETDEAAQPVQDKPQDALGTSDGCKRHCHSKCMWLGSGPCPHKKTQEPGQARDWMPMETAPKDGTMLRLLVQFDENATEDSAEPCPTIGANSFVHSGDDMWQFAGWNWEQDCFDEGVGTPVGWLPLLEAQAAPSVPDGWNEVIEALEFYAGGHHFTLHDPSAWDTVSGEPMNFQEDEACTATVEDGSVAKMALEKFAAAPSAPKRTKTKEKIMDQKEIQERIGTKVTEAEMVDMLKSQPVGTGPNDVRVRSGVLSFSFGPGGVTLTGAEQRNPITK